MPYSLVEFPNILTALHQVPGDGKLHICSDGNHKSTNVNFGHATTEASLFLLYEEEQKYMNRQTCYKNVLCRQLEKGCSVCWSWGVIFFSCGAVNQSGPWPPLS
jgi:hypothetical protein